MNIGIYMYINKRKEKIGKEEKMMTEFEKAQAGFLYDANYDPKILESRMRCDDLCWEFNQKRPSDQLGKREILEQIIPGIPEDAVITQPFYCDYGFNIKIGKAFYSNHNLCILDGAKVTIGDYCFIAPDCVISTAGHAFDVEQRNAGLEIALPITIGNNVWIGAGVMILPGITIGNDTIIGAGSVVNKDIPDGVIAAGNPCKVIRPVTEKDKNRYPVWK